MTTRSSHQARAGQTLADRLERLRELSARATPGRWHWWTSNSWLRLGTDARGNDRNGTPYGQDGYVAYPYVSRSDKHPNLCIRNPADRELITEAVNFVRALLDAPPCNSTDVDGWRPIESAPQDGTRLWLFYPGCAEDDRQQVGWWEDDPFNGPRWMDHADSEQSDPTHWRPLPSAPPHVAPETPVERDGGAS